MKSKALICALAAASLGFASLSFAQGYYDRGGPGREAPRGEQRGPMGRDGHDAGPRGFDQRDARDNRNYGARGPQFHRGGRIPPQYRSRQYVVEDWRRHRLNAPPRGYQWVQVGADYVLIAVATGVIAQLILSQ